MLPHQRKTQLRSCASFITKPLTRRQQPLIRKPLTKTTLVRAERHTPAASAERKLQQDTSFASSREKISSTTTANSSSTGRLAARSSTIAIALATLTGSTFAPAAAPAGRNTNTDTSGNTVSAKRRSTERTAPARPLTSASSLCSLNNNAHKQRRKIRPFGRIFVLLRSISITVRLIVQQHLRQSCYNLLEYVKIQSEGSL